MAACRDSGHVPLLQCFTAVQVRRYSPRWPFSRAGRRASRAVMSREGSGLESGTFTLQPAGRAACACAESADRVMFSLRPKVALKFGRKVARHAGLVLAGLAVIEAPAATTLSREHEIKAAALYNLIAYTEWPRSAFASGDSPMVVGVLGEGPVSGLLEEFLASERCQGRRVVLRRLSSATEGRSCHVVYVARSSQGQWPAIARALFRAPVLTVSDADDFAKNGGMIQLAIERNKLRLVVNLGVAHGAGLSISSKVLRLAHVINHRVP